LYLINKRKEKKRKEKKRKEKNMLLLYNIMKPFFLLE